MQFLLWALVVLCVLFLGYVFLCLPHLPRRPMDPLMGWDYAHRGLWNRELPENSLAAFRNAVAHGFGMEMDVHLTADEQLVVFHDDDLQRMCGDSRRISACTLAELQQLRLLDTNEGIPTFDAFLNTVNGQTPLIIELKSDQKMERLCELVEERLRSYPGVYCVESFNPTAVRWWRKHRPDVIRGQLTLGLVKPGKTKKTTETRLLASMMINVLGRPDFVAMETITDHSLPMRLQRLLRPWLVAWTVRSREEMDRLRGRYDLQIFEGFVPEKTKKNV